MYSLPSALLIKEASGYMLAQDLVGDGVKLAMNCSARCLTCTPFLAKLKEEIGRVLSVCLEVTARCVVADLFQITGLTVPSKMYICF